MDPISIISLTITSAKIIDTCADAVFNLSEIRERWKKAPALLESIGRECETIGATISLIKQWLESRSRESVNDDYFLQTLHSALKYCLEVLGGLQQSTAEYRNNKDPLQWKRFKLMVNESSLRQSLEELRWQVQATNNLWNTFNL